MNWIISINKLVQENESELRQSIRELLSEPNNMEELIPQIFAATQEEEPYASLEDWLSREPGMMSCLDFIKPPEVTPAAEVMVSDRRRPIDISIATVAATSLMDGLSDHFILDEFTGFLRINAGSPPTITQAETMMDRVMSIHSSANKLAEFGKWQLGALYDTCENAFGEDFSIGDFSKLGENAYNTVITSVNTFRAFAQKRYNLSFTHHKEAFYCNLEDDEDKSLMHKLMSFSEYYSLACVEQRKMFSYVRNYGVEGLEADIDVDWEFNEDQVDEIKAENPNAILCRQDLVERVTVKSANKNYLFEFSGMKYHWRGTLDALPRGALNIICTDDWKGVREDGRESEIPQWIRPGEATEVPNA